MICCEVCAKQYLSTGVCDEDTMEIQREFMYVFVVFENKMYVLKMSAKIVFIV